MQSWPSRPATVASYYEAIFKTARRALSSGVSDTAVQSWISFLFGSSEWRSRARQAVEFMQTQTPAELAQTPLIIDAIVKSFGVLLQQQKTPLSTEAVTPSSYGLTTAAAARRAIELGMTALETAQQGGQRRWAEDGAPSQRLAGWLVFGWERALEARASSSVAVGGGGGQVVAALPPPPDSALDDRLKKIERSLSDAQSYMVNVNNNATIARKNVIDLDKRLQSVEELARQAADDAHEAVEFVQGRYAAAVVAASPPRSPLTAPPSSPLAAPPSSPLAPPPPQAADVTELLFGRLVEQKSWPLNVLADAKRIVHSAATLNIQDDITAFLLSQSAVDYGTASLTNTSPLKQALDALNQDPALFFGHQAPVRLAPGHQAPVRLAPATIEEMRVLSARVERQVLSNVSQERRDRIRDKPHVVYNDADVGVRQHLDLYERALTVGGRAGESLLESSIEVVERAGTLYAVPAGTLALLYGLYFAATKGDYAKSLRRGNALAIALTLELMRTLRALQKSSKAEAAAEPAAAVAAEMVPSSCHARSEAGSTTTIRTPDLDITVVDGGSTHHDSGAAAACCDDDDYALPPSEAIPPRPYYAPIHVRAPLATAEAALAPPTPAVVTPAELAPSVKEYANARASERQRMVDDHMRFAQMALARENESLLQVQSRWLRPVLEWRRANVQRGDERALASDREHLAKLLRDFTQTKTGKASEKRAEIERIALAI